MIAATELQSSRALLAASRAASLTSPATLRAAPLSLVYFAFGLQLLVACQFAGRVLYGALHLIRSAFYMFTIHGFPLAWCVSTITRKRATGFADFSRNFPQFQGRRIPMI